MASYGSFIESFVKKEPPPPFVSEQKKPSVITENFIEKEKKFLTRPDGLQFTGVEKPQIIAPFKPVEDAVVPAVIGKPKKLNPLVKELLNKIDEHAKNTAKGVEVSVKRLIGAVDDGSKTASSISTALPVAFPDTSQPIAKRVKFSPFKFRVWTKGDKGIDVKNKTIPVGTYIFTLKTPVAFPDIAELDTAIPFKVDGKQAVLEKVAYDKETATMKVQVRIVQNFVLLTSVLLYSLAAGVVGGSVYFASEGATDMLQSVDRVVDTSIVGIVVVGGGFFILKRMGYL